MQTLSHHETPHGHDGHHFVRFYDDEELLADEIAQHLLAALTQQGSAIVIATPARVAAILPRLRAASAVAPDLLARLVVRDAADTLAAITTDGWPDDDRFDAVVGTLVRETGSTGAPLHAYGEMVALLCAEGRFEAAVRLEQLWNTLAERTTFSLFCAYPWTLFPTVELANSFAAICQAHTHACSQKQPAAGTVSRPDQFRLLDLERKALALDGEVRRRRDAERMAASSEADLADFLDNAAEGIHRVGADGTILWANKAELALLGYRWEEYVGRHIGEFHADPHVIDHILATLQKGETIYDQPARLRCKDGSIRHVLIHSNACFENGELRYTRCFTRDATERHERDALLATLTEANRNKDQFLAMLGHELRNPLSPILLALEMMELRGDKATTERQLIRRQVDHLVRLVDDLLDIARVTQGKVVLRRARLPVSEVIDKAVELAAAEIAAHSHQLTLTVDPALVVCGDAVRLAQVLANLLINAARYTPRQGRIRLHAARDAAGQVRIGVTDNGRGMAAAELRQAFDLFYQGARGIDRAEGGLGVGLALARRLVELHEGRIDAFSAGPGMGCEVVVRLPAFDAAAPRPPAAAANDAPAPGGGLTILLVDDNEDAVRMLGMLLTQHGHRVDVCFDPHTALARVDTLRPDVAVLAIGLPLMSGHELAQRLRVLPGGERCRLIALSGYGQPADLAHSRAAGFEAHLVKPVMPERLLALLAHKQAAR